MKIDQDDRLAGFRCRHPSGDCLIGLHDGMTDEYSIDGTQVLCNGETIGDLIEQTLQQIICSDHCNLRFLDEIERFDKTPVKTRSNLRVVKKLSKPRLDLEAMKQRWAEGR